MNFCVKCDNLYYLKLKDDSQNNLIYYCRHCGHETNEFDSKNVCVLNTQIKRTDEKYTHVVNEYTKFDPTLPHIKTIKCPNQTCKGSTSQSDIIYLRYDDVNIKYVYMCTHCDTTWKTNDQ